MKVGCRKLSWMSYVSKASTLRQKKQFLSKGIQLIEFRGEYADYDYTGWFKMDATLDVYEK